MAFSHARSSALQVLLGAWLALGVATWFMAAASFLTSSRVAEESRVAERLSGLEDGAGVLRYQAAETNRLSFTVSSRSQVLLGGLAVLLAAWPPATSRAVLALIALAAALSSGIAFFVVPAALDQGAALALVPRPLPESLMSTKQAMETSHRLYSSLDMLRTVLVAVAALLLVRQARKAAPVAAALALVLLAPGCSTGAPPKEDPTPAAATPSRPPASARPAASARTVAFDAGRAWRHLEAVVAMGPRLDGFPGHERFRKYAAREFEAQGWTVTEQPFTYSVPGEEKVYELANISALLGPRNADTILLGTHYDTRPWCDEESDPALRRRPVPGANDGGSGVAVLLEIARILGEKPPEHGVEIVLFDGEDLGRPGNPSEYSQGAQHLVREWKTLNAGAPFPSAVIVIDMVADADLEFIAESAAMAASPDLTRRLWAAAEELGHGSTFSNARTRGIYDDHRPFLEAGVPAALLIDLDYEPWHTVRDTIDKCSPESLEITGQVVLEAFFGD